MIRAMQNPLKGIQQTLNMGQMGPQPTTAQAPNPMLDPYHTTVNGQRTLNGQVQPQASGLPLAGNARQFDPMNANMGQIPTHNQMMQFQQMVAPNAQSPQSPFMQQGPVQQSGFGYQVNPGTGGYFEQQTPLGSFAGASQQRASATGMMNPYIGQTAQQAAGAGAVNAATAPTNNPYLGQQTQQVAYQGAQSAGTNPYAGSNPYLTQAIEQAGADTVRNYNLAIAPQRDRQMAMSGSFGNSGVQQMQLEDQRNLGATLANQASGMRMQDYGMQQGLAENALNRQQGLNQFNAGNQLQAGLANAGFNAGDLSRNLGASTQLGMFNAGQMNNMGQFNAAQQNAMSQFNAGMGQADLTRNANLAQGMGQFNAGAANQASMFNAGQGNAMNQFNAGSANQMLGQQRNLAQNQRQFDTTFGEGVRRYDEGMDFQTWAANNNLQRQGTFDNLAVMQALMNMNQGGLGAANQQRQQPITDWQTFMQAANQAGGLGGSSLTPYFGNPFLGFLGGAQLGGRIFGG